MRTQTHDAPLSHHHLQARWQRWRQQTESSLDCALRSRGAGDERLVEAMRYACLDGGKRIRALLVYASGAVFTKSTDIFDPIAAAVEMVHAYSLIHDDLPAMDDDDLRRGKPACHRAFGEALAILAGDALQPRAFELIAESTAFSDRAKLEMTTTLARAAGYQGMVCGQAIDLESTGVALTQTDLEHMHRRKTGALIKAAVRLGAIAGGARHAEDFNALDAFADALGLAFQIVDDILDVEGSTNDLGKRQGSDREQGKTTYVTLMGVERARLVTEKLHQDALASLSCFGDNGAHLAAIIDFAVKRRN